MHHYLIALAESKDMIVRASVTVNLGFLCCGEYPSASKVNKAQQFSIYNKYQLKY